MTDLEKVSAAIHKLMKRELPLALDTRLREDLALDSSALIELTVLLHGLYGVDLGRRAAERKFLPATVGDIVTLMGAA
jgi:acyl carrier protein